MKEFGYKYNKIEKFQNEQTSSSKAIVFIKDKDSLLNFLNTNTQTNPANLNINYTYMDIDLSYTTLSLGMVTNFNILLKYLNTNLLNITALFLNSCGMTAGMVAILLDGINLSKCIYLTLANNTLNINDVSKLNTSIKFNSDLNKLLLHNCGIGGMIATLLSNINLSLSLIDLSNNILDSVDISTLNNRLRPTSLKYLYLNNCNMIPNMIATLLNGVNLSNCIDLDLIGNKFGSNDIMRLNSVLRSSFLTKLALKNCDITDGMLATLLDGINLSKCSFIDLSNNTLIVKDVEALNKSLGPISLNYLIMNNCGIGGMIGTLLNGIDLSKCNSIYLNENNLDTKDVQALNKSLGPTSFLKVLFLNNCGIGGMIETLLNDINLSKCKFLYLNENKLDTKDVQALNKSLGPTPVLQKLNLEMCSMTAGMVAILLANIKLVVDDLIICNGNEFNQADVNAIKMSISNPNISICNISFPTTQKAPTFSSLPTINLPNPNLPNPNSPNPNPPNSNPPNPPNPLNPSNPTPPKPNPPNPTKLPNPIYSESSLSTFQPTNPPTLSSLQKQTSNNVQLNQKTKSNNNMNKLNIFLIIIIILIFLVIGYITKKKKAVNIYNKK
jgi:hypothetical protein